jgi:hypothetical protein
VKIFWLDLTVTMALASLLSAEVILTLTLLMLFASYPLLKNQSNSRSVPEGKNEGASTFLQNPIKTGISRQFANHPVHSTWWNPSSRRR